ncbi:hypothetical protein BLNAU_9936 [Blattamonas nauphoetae]|uniref:Protein kinase domain-containing protein n=1 Tax=Blattamonas nauphoetae TaxID=2049346 RepID=A0ABQ9XUP7_9EUKA|nr:hypothetical protein BLNAU_9936 [Blattamonas nauphoetae]
MKDDIIDTAHPSSVGILRNNTAECKLPNEEKSSNPTFAPNSKVEPIRPMVRVMECQGEYAARTVVKTETLYDRLHRTKQPNWNTDRLRMIQQLVRGLAVARQSNTTDQILTELSPHKIVVNDGNEVLISLPSEREWAGGTGKRDRTEGQLRQTEAKTTPSHPHTTLSGARDRASFSAGTDEERSTLTSSSMMMKANENVRWTPPEVTGRKSGVDKEKAAVFSLGLILWEIETGEVASAGPSDATDAGAGGVDTGLSLTTQTTKKGQSQQNEAIGML